MNDTHFQRLLDLYLDGGLQPDELAEFERILLSSDRARQVFWQQAHLHQALRRNGAESWGVGAFEPVQIPQSKSILGMPLRWVGAVAALIAISLVTWSVLHHTSDQSIEPLSEPSFVDSNALPPKPAPLPASVAVISEVVRAKWDTSEELKKGAAVGPGKIYLRSGLVGLTFYNGAHVMVEGPAEVDVLSDSTMRLNRGHIHVECPEVAYGFTVFAPGGRVVDMGAVFGLSVDENGVTEVQAVKGLVGIRGNQEEADVELRERAVAVIETAGLIHFRETPDRISAQNFSKRVHDQEQKRFQKWQKDSARRVGDKDLLVYLRMLEDKDSSARLIKNEGSEKPVSSDAAIIAPNWVNGRWPGKRALLFQSQDERARIDIKGRYTHLTFAAWVRIVGFQRPFNALFMSDRHIGGELHWQFSDRGAFRFSIQPNVKTGEDQKPSSRFYRMWSEELLSASDNGVWRHLVTSYDGENKRVVHYIDGQKVSYHTLPESVAVGFGKATIGNTSYATKQYWGSREFGGAVDEFAIFSRVLSAEEIKKLYKEGRPD